MIQMIDSIYPGLVVPKFAPIIGNNRTVCPKIRKEAIEMINRGIEQYMISKKLSIDPSTIKSWCEPSERY